MVKIYQSENLQGVCIMAPSASDLSWANVRFHKYIHTKMALLGCAINNWHWYVYPTSDKGIDKFYTLYF